MFSSEKSNYDLVQCIGVTMDTTRYRGLPNDEEDIKFRCKVLEEIIEEATESCKINNSEDCMKVLVLPEFFFRGSIGAYTMEDITKLVERLRNMVQGEKYKDWLFIFGSMVGYSKPEEYIENEEEYILPELLDKKSEYEAYNFSFIQKGNCGEEKSYVVMKQHKSYIDFEEQLGQKGLTIWNTRYLKPCSSKDEKFNKINYDGNGIIDIDGIRFGVELCLDNIRNRIDRSINIDKRPIQVQIIVSCGLREESHSMRLDQNGIVLKCDGKYNETILSDYNEKNIKKIGCIHYCSEDLNIFRRVFNNTYAVIDFFSPVNIRNREKQIQTYCKVL